MTFRLSLFIFILLLLTPWVLPGSRTGNDGHDPSLTGQVPEITSILEKYQSLHESALNCDAFIFGMMGYRSLLSKGLVKNDSLLTIIDFSLPSVDYRLFVINLNRNAVVFKSLVSHGRNSGELYARRFSNKIQSHQSALGFYVTGEPYRGGQGYSLQLIGLDTGYNDLSKVRSIVIHGAGYATQDYANRYGRLGRSFGCLALPPVMNAPIVNEIKGGSVVFSYFPDQAYLSRSVILHEGHNEVPGGTEGI
jgi:hypothetical protein